MKKTNWNFIFSFVITLVIITCLSSCDNSCKHDNIEKKTTKVTCTQAGKTTYTCPDCDFSYVDSIENAKGHNFEEKIIAPDCVTGGYTEYTCNCGFSYKDKLTEPTSHDFSPLVTLPSCEKQGYTLNKCKNCDYSYKTDFVEPTSHNFTAEITAPTCTEEGYTVFSCSDCEYRYTSDYTKPTGHNYISTITPATCTEQGFTAHTCDGCLHAYVSDYTDPLGHSYTESIVSIADCTTTGETKYTCICGDNYSVYTEPLGHSFDIQVTMPTISDMGFTEFTCKNENCNFGYIGDYTFFSQILPNGAYSGNSEPLNKGIDVSVWNYTVNSDNSYASLDWNGLKEGGIEYAIIKAGSSIRFDSSTGIALGGIDPTFEQSYNDAKQAGFNVGAYFYTYAKSVAEIKKDAYILISILDGKQFEYPIYLDLEDESLKDIDNATLTEMCVEFFTILQRAGYYTGLYVNNEWLVNKINTDFALSKFEIWYARYGTETVAEWNTDVFGQHLGMWQYYCPPNEASDFAFDLNYTYKDYPTIIINGGFNGFESNVKFLDDENEYVWIKFNGSQGLNVRSSSNFFIDDEVMENDIIGTVFYGECFLVIEKNEQYTKILYYGKEAYISANTEKYISFDGLY